MKQITRTGYNFAIFAFAPHPCHRETSESSFQQFAYVHRDVGETLGSGFIARAENGFRTVGTAGK